MHWYTLEMLDILITSNTWLAKVLSVKKNRLCFVLFSVGAAYWIVRNFYLGLYAMPVIGVLNIIINIYGFVNWGKKS